MTTKMYLVRHCEAEGNLYRRCHGHYDGLLTENGKAQRHTLEEYFRSLNIDRVYSSDLRRAYATALAIARPKGLEPEQRTGLREMCMGVWEDLPWGETMYRYPAQHERFTHKKHLFSVNGAETALQAQERMYAVTAEIARRHAGETVVVVTHGLALQLLLARLMDYPLERAGDVTHSDNGSVALVEWADKPEVLFYGYNQHLGGLSTFAKQSWWRKDAGEEDVSLRFAPALLPEDAEQVTEMQAKAWEAVYGNLELFDAAATLQKAECISRENPQNLLFAIHKGQNSGLLSLDPAGSPDPTAGHISLIYLGEGLRGQGIGVQLIGQAVSHYRKRGKTAVRLKVSPKNLQARRFYEKHGFRLDGQVSSRTGTLLLMRKGIIWDKEMEYR